MINKKRKFSFWNWFMEQGFKNKFSILCVIVTKYGERVTWKTLETGCNELYNQYGELEFYVVTMCIPIVSSFNTRTMIRGIKLNPTSYTEFTPCRINRYNIMGFNTLGKVELGYWVATCYVNGQLVNSYDVINKSLFDRIVVDVQDQHAVITGFINDFRKDMSSCIPYLLSIVSTYFLKYVTTYQTMYFYVFGFLSILSMTILTYSTCLSAKTKFLHNISFDYDNKMCSDLIKRLKLLSQDSNDK